MNNLDSSYQRFSQSFYRAFGINLTGYKVNQMQRRIGHFMERCKCAGYDQFLHLLSSDKEVENQFINYLTINVTEFFRNPDLFRQLETEILPPLVQRSGSLKMWSAACSNGAEPYSLAIIMQDKFPGKGYQIDATDIDEEMLKRSKQGEYFGEVLKNLSPQRLNNYFIATGKGYEIKKSVSAHVAFRKHNLLSDEYPSGYDLILCRNVTIYFTPEAQDYCYLGFSKSLKPGGVLFIGASENIFNYRKYGLERICPSFFKKS
ncbi:MAG: protein-glutamate O-methyltransferase CheR [Dehalobacterium sp.]